MATSKKNDRSKKHHQKEQRRKNRQARSRSPLQRNLANSSSEEPVKNSRNYITIEHGPMTMVAEVTGAVPAPDDKNIKVDMTPLEDTILPVPLKFNPPLQEFGMNEKAFNRHWQRLTYLFELDDPTDFSDLSSELSEGDKELLDRFVHTCCRLAQYSTINGKTSVSLSSGPDGKASVQAILPDDEAFAGFSTSFRQLHNQDDEASFAKAWNVLNRAQNSLIKAGTVSAGERDVLTAWKTARNKLSSGLPRVWLTPDP